MMKRVLASFLILSTLFIFSPVPYAQAVGIARDNSSSNRVSGTTTNSFSYTDGSGANRALSVETQNESTANPTSITYNSVAMTQLSCQQDGGFTGHKMCIYYLANPASGANTLTATWAGNESSVVFVQSYTGASQTTPTNVVFNSAHSVTDLAVAVTGTVSTSWVVGEGYDSDTNTITITSGGTILTNNGNDASMDSNTTTGGGTYTTNWHYATTATLGQGISVELPIAAATAVTQISIVGLIRAYWVY